VQLVERFISSFRKAIPGKIVVIADVSYFESRSPDSAMTRMLRSASSRGTVVRLSPSAADSADVTG